GLKVGYYHLFKKCVSEALEEDRQFSVFSPKLSPLCENVKRTLKPKVRKGLLNALSHISDATYQNILFVKLVPDWLNN
ncbi:MAG: hypothetical protein WCF82_10800, partial [Microcoleus sp.]